MLFLIILQINFDLSVFILKKISFKKMARFLRSYYGMLGKRHIKVYLFAIALFVTLSANSHATLLWESDYGSLAQQGIPVSEIGGVAIGAANYNIGFDFQFYGETFSDLWINSLGTVSFGDSNLNPVNDPFPAEQDLVNVIKQKPQPYERTKMIAPLWDFLLTNPDAKEDGSTNPDTGVWANLTGTPGSQKLVLTWNDVSNFNLSGSPTPYYGSNTFQLILLEGSNDIIMSYLNLDGVKSPIHSGGTLFPESGNYVPNDYNGITIGVNAGDLPGSSIIRGTEYLYGFVSDSQLPEYNSIIFKYDSNYYGTGIGGYTVSIYEPTSSPIPEPSTLWLMASSIVGYFLYSFKRSKSR